MKVVIGIIKNDRNKVEACRVYDTDLRKYEDISVQKIKNIIGNGQRVVGYLLNNRITYTRDNKKDIVLRKQNGCFSFDIAPKINGYGMLVNIEDSNINTLLGWIGFAENKYYIVVNWNGTLTKLNQDDFLKEVQNRRINGAKYDNVNNRFHFCMSLNNELEMNLEDI